MPQIGKASIDQMDNAQIFTLKQLPLYLKLAEKTPYRLASDAKLPGCKGSGND